MSARAPAFEALPWSLGDHFDALRRRATLAGLVFGSVMLLTLLVAFLWPPTYRSSGTVLIEQQEVPDEFVRAAVTSYAEQRVRMIAQRVMTTQNLLRIIREFELYPRRQKTEPRERLLERMRDDIGLEMISADVMDPRQGRPTKATIAFTVSFDSRSPAIAAKVANEITTLFLNENLQTRRQLADDTEVFLRSEADRVGAELQALDQRLADFRSRHAGALPELAQVNIQLMTRLEEELRANDARIAALNQQLVFLESQLAQIDPVAPAYSESGQRLPSAPERLKLLRTSLASVSGLYGPEHPDVVRLKREITGLEQLVGAADDGNDLVRQLETTKSRLAAARSRYSPEHPDVRLLERLVASIEDAMRRSGSAAASARATPPPDNPAYIEIRAQREAARNERDSLASRSAELRARIGDFEDRLARSPEVEREYNALTRDLEGAQFKYQEVRQKQMAAQVAANLETEQKGERFTLIEPPLVPEEPVRPNRPLLLALGALLALAAAVGAPVLAERAGGRVRNRRDLERLVNVAPLATIPWFDTGERQTAGRPRLWWTVGGALLALLLVALAVHVFLRPLDVLWYVLLRRLGT